MKRFGSTESFLDMLARVAGDSHRKPVPAATSSSASPARPRRTCGNSSDSWRRLGLDAIGVFGYSDEDGTEAASLPDKIDADVIADRVARIAALADELIAQRAEDRVGIRVEVLIEQIGAEVVGPGGAPGPRRRRHDTVS